MAQGPRESFQITSEETNAYYDKDDKLQPLLEKSSEGKEPVASLGLPAKKLSGELQDQKQTETVVKWEKINEENEALKKENEKVKMVVRKLRKESKVESDNEEAFASVEESLSSNEKS